MLCRCNKSEDLTEWNSWRRQNPSQDICLDNADFNGFYLQGANLGQYKQHYIETNQEIDFSGNVYMQGANFRNALVINAVFANSHLEKTCWYYAKAIGASFHSAHLNKAKLGAGQFDKCDFNGAFLENAMLTSSSLCGTTFLNTDLRGCRARGCVINGETKLWNCKANRKTDFTGVALNSIGIDPGTKQLLEYYIRYINWEQWYTKHSKLKWIVKLFWWISDYGRSTGRIIKVFFGLSFLFSVVYYLWAVCFPPGIISGMLESQEALIPAWVVPLRAFYFSIVTMTTLGFGDMYANGHSIWGHLLLILQVLLGYTLLGALVTRFALLFTVGGPAEEVSKQDIEHNENHDV